MQSTSLTCEQLPTIKRAWSWAFRSPQSCLRHAYPFAASAAQQHSRGRSGDLNNTRTHTGFQELQADGCLRFSGHGQQQQQQQLLLQHHHSSSSPAHSRDRPRNAAGNLLPDQLLFNSIKACSSLFDCQQLLSACGQRLDAMLLSTLVTQTVHVAVGQPEQQQQYQEQHEQQDTGPPLQQQSTAAAAASYSTHRSSSSSGLLTQSSTESSSSSSRAAGNSRGAAQALSRYLRQLSGVALQLCSSFRPQQFSNVLWGLAKCGYRAPNAWLGRYVAQAELQLQHFAPRNLAQLAWALATMKAQPPRSFLANFLAECSDKLSSFKPIDLANTLWALATMAVTPPADWLSYALAACSSQWPKFKPQELAITVWGLAKLRAGFRVQPHPAHPHYGLTAELGEDGLVGLMAAAAWQVPVMTPQQASNLVWGFAVGGAVLPPQQLQALAGQVLLVLRNSSSSCCSHALTTVTWALTKLQWTPSQPQATLLLTLLQQHQQQHSLNVRQAALLLWCLGRLRVRLPAAAMQQLMAQLQGSMHLAAPADVVQVLVGVKALGWRPSKQWWRGFYSSSGSSSGDGCDGSLLLEQASVGELAQLLAAAATVKPVRPDKGWWLNFWQQVGEALDATFEARRLQRKGQLVQRAGSSSSSLVQASSNAAGSSSSTAARMAQLRARLLQAGSSSSSISSLSALKARRRRANAAASERALLRINPWPVIHRHMQQYVKVRAAAAPLPPSCISNGQPHALVGPHSALLLLWAAAKLRLAVPKKALWQLLLLVLTDMHCYSPAQLATVMQTLGVMIADRGHDAVQCHMLLKLLAVSAQWRLHKGFAGEGEVRRRYVRALKFMAHEANVSPLLILDWKGSGDS